LALNTSNEKTGKAVINFVIIGCGRIAERHAEHIFKRGKLVAVCDIVKEKADRLGSAYGARSYSDISALLKTELNVDVASICTPNGLHAVHTIECLNKGIHVLCEKPMAINVQDCQAMINAAERNNKLLAIVKQNRFNPPVVAVKKIMDEGKLGKILSVQLNCFWNRDAAYYHNSWKGTLELDGGTLFTQFSHFIDLLYWMFGDIEQVGSFMNNFAHKNIIEFEDTGVVIVKFKSNALGTINYTVNSYGKNMEGSLTVFGEKGTVKIGGEYLNRLEYQNISDYCIENLPAGNSANHYGNYVGSMSNHDKVYDNLVDAVRSGAALSTNAAEGLKTVQIIEQVYKAANKI
jgi:UDP-N-acetyl-2-amino-2-deoxyglucuronate dehydrogenase